jgi:N-acetylated-alpha-linked acidic dipeptidase
MSYSTRLPMLITGALVAAAPLSAQQKPIRGFPSSMLATEAQHEEAARAVPNPDTMKNQLLILSEDPHEAGTDRSKHVAQLILQRFQSYGLDAHIEEFEALMPRPVDRVLELVAPVEYTAQLKEPAIPEDKDSGDPNQLPTFNAYAADGDVTAPLVFVNYGIPEDYRVLDSLGISVQGRIVIAKYGRSWRGIKAKVAGEHGAVGCIIYSDPKDDGYRIDDVYPKGPMRPWQGVQRGSVMDMPTYPGDPLSPGFASEPGEQPGQGQLLAIAAAKTIMKIPVLPISYGDAQHLLGAVGGPVAPRDWQGALPITYHVGPGEAKVHLKVAFDWKERPLYDVIARIPGSRSPDQWVIYGNHHDAWVNGAEDPLSGQVALDESARALASLLKTGWRPARTVIFAAWDGEEWGLLGSTEWAEKHEAELREHGAVYLGSDTNSRGWLGVAGSHSLQEFFRQLERDIADPTTSKSVLEAGMQHRRDSVFTIGALGSGSDYTAFLDHVGMATANASYGGGQESGIYHSIYDSYDFYTRFLDPTFQYEKAEAQTMATALIRLADAPVLPLEFGQAAQTYRRYLDEIAAEASKADATHALDLGAVRTALEHVDDAAKRYEGAYASVESARQQDVQRRWKKLAVANGDLIHVEQALLDSAGLPQRSWFEHTIYAPGYYTGYGVKTMPGIREAVEDKPDLQVAQAQAAHVAAALERYAAAIDKAAQDLSAALK